LGNEFAKQNKMVRIGKGFGEPVRAKWDRLKKSVMESIMIVMEILMNRLNVQDRRNV
jgi:hypothetical protein